MPPISSFIGRRIVKIVSTFWAQLALASLVAISGPKNVSIFRTGPRNGFSRIKIVTSRAIWTTGTLNKEDKAGVHDCLYKDYPLSLPGGIKNPRIRPFMSGGACVGTIPAETLLPAVQERGKHPSCWHSPHKTQQEVLTWLAWTATPLDRTVPPSFTEHNTVRTVVIGGSAR